MFCWNTQKYRSAVVLARDNIDGETQLIAYIVAATDELAESQ